MNIRSFVNLEGKAVVDSREDLMDIVAAQYQNKEDQEDQKEAVHQITVSKPIIALNT
jgi:hypothetical protein